MQGSTPVDCEVLNVIQGAGIWPDCEDKTQLLQAINTLISGGGSGGGNTVIIGSEIGTVSAFAMPTAPDGWLICDGSAVSRTDYAYLFATIGTVWGHGDQITTFNLPDLRGEFVRGFDAGRGLDAGREFGAIQFDQMQGHRHGYSLGENAHNGPEPTYAATGTPLGIVTGTSTRAGADFFINGPKEDGVNGMPRIGDETRPRNIAMTYAIKAFYPTAQSGQ